MQKIFIKNKKANSQWLSPWMILNWAIIIIALIIVSFWFFAHFSDVREQEAVILNQRMGSCLSKDFSLKEFNSSGFDIFTKCQLNKELFNQELYYVGLTLKDISGKEIKSINLGADWKVECNYQQETKKIESNFAQCYFNNIFLIDSKTQATYQLEIISASNQK